MNSCILFFVRYPEPGTVKTRLAANTTPEAAAEFYQALVEEKLPELARATDAELFVCYSPEDMCDAMTDWLGHDYLYLSQKGAELGKRMENAFREVFFMGYEHAVLVGSDIPMLDGPILTRALQGLKNHDACIGPTEDGGYYLIGFQRGSFTPEVFRDMEWSRNDVLERTMHRLAALGVDAEQLDMLDDVDTLEDLEALVTLGANGPLRGNVLQAARRLIQR
ncbi:TIGR04282 family arsenosugar biosynthesis glycosyltransferase [Pseudodesulfovibrio tunisiensis]|uniref:TIGR04282 family arsenosugar biosynthesis glycosyltransferase n=1 Tax=Pseudodesulfovibrio tunisiensis TaxID=463192 RepID=UPI001FB3FDC2|nr:TIGR04282 family arsenosugar biosynthesis glycosyltransferase [Pseudodesulfovibrio tunisiensis]